MARASTSPSPDASADATRPVLLLHGFASSPRVLGPLQRFLRRRLGRDVIRVPISPGLQCLRESAQELHAFVEELSRDRGLRFVDVVGHSMGGLVAAYLLKKLDRGSRVRTVVTLGTPHGGAPLAGTGARLLGGLSPAVRQMRAGSDLLGELEELATPPGSELVALAGGRDRLVPAGVAAASDAPRQRTVVLERAGHTCFLLDRSIFAVVRAALAAGPAGAGRRRPRRRTTTVLCADAVAYARHMADEELVTHRVLSAHRELLRAEVVRHGGRVVDAVGDGLLAEFACPVAAVRSAEAMQLRIERANRALHARRRLHFRIGLHRASVLCDGERISGHGVNLAARVEGLAAPGGVAVTDAVRMQIEGRLSLPFEDWGTHRLKNIPAPVGIHHAAVAGPRHLRPLPRVDRTRRRERGPSRAAV